MPPATYAAPEIVAMMTAARPDLMRQMLEFLGYSQAATGDPWDAAVVNSCLLSGAVDESPVGRVSSSYARHLRFHGRSDKFVKDSSSAVLRALFSLGSDAFAEAFREGSEQREAVSRTLATQGVDDALAAKTLELLAKFFPEYETAIRRWEFGYSTNVSAFGVAAAACGGSPTGELGTNHLAIVDLPFSAFVGTTDDVDPTVMQSIREAGDMLKTATNHLFRIEWSVGNRIASSLNGYRRFLSVTFPKIEFKVAVVENGKLDPTLAGADAFIAGSASWTGRFKPVEVLSSAENGQGADHNAPAVEAAIRGLLRAI
jgi:hypothetical protein